MSIIGGSNFHYRRFQLIQLPGSVKIQCLVPLYRYGEQAGDVTAEALETGRSVAKLTYVRVLILHWSLDTGHCWIMEKEKLVLCLFLGSTLIKGFHCVISVVLPTLDLLELGFLGSTLRGSTVL